MAGSSLIVLEGAELAARERRLAAVAEAERIVAAATERAAAIEAAIPGQVEAALADRRREHEVRAASAVAAIEAELADLERAVARPDLERAGPRGAATDPAFEAAVALVVAAVLGETDPEG
jgi:hypothetical protein